VPGLRLAIAGLKLGSNAAAIGLIHRSRQSHE